MTLETNNDKDGAGSSTAKVCRRCGAADAQNVVRQELLCQDCLEKYVKTKVIKRLEAFRGRHADPKNPHKWLLPLSGGPSSLSLLHILNDNLERQIQRSGHASYELQCVHISGLQGSENTANIEESLSVHYPRHAYTILPLMTENEAENDLIMSILAKRPDMASDSDKTSAAETIAPVSLRSDLSTTSKSDLVNILIHKTLLRAAKALNCNGVLLGDTTTRLAEKVLAETSKGRGMSLPAQVNDHKSRQDIWVFYPMKDVLKKEMLQFAQSLRISPLLRDHDLGSSNSQSVVRNMSIDSLMTGYFQSVEENYPSVVANVVRTSGKLQNSGSVSFDHGICLFCEMPIESQDSGSELHSSATHFDHQSTLCHGCKKLTTVLDRSFSNNS